MEQSVNVLIVEDDPDINALLCGILERKGCAARSAYSGSEAELCLSRYDYQLVMLDLMLPGLSGEELIRRIRRVKTMPVIVISAKSDCRTKIEALNLGADDFISKPFDVEEIAARAKAQLRRYMRFSDPRGGAGTAAYKGIVLDREARKVSVNGNEIVLTAREFDILELLVTHPGKVFTKANLFEHAWNEPFLGDENTINVHISNIRSKLAAADPGTGYIRTVWGIGFKMQE